MFEVKNHLRGVSLRPHEKIECVDKAPASCSGDVPWSLQHFWVLVTTATEAWKNVLSGAYFMSVKCDYPDSWNIMAMAINRGIVRMVSEANLTHEPMWGCHFYDRGLTG